MGKPQWATPERQATLVRLWRRYGGRCHQGHRSCSELGHYLHQTQRVELAARPEAGGRVVPVVVTTIEAIRPYILAQDDARETWKADDRDRRHHERIEASRTAPTGEVGVFGRTMTNYRPVSDPVTWDVDCESRPEYYLLNQGVDTGRPFAKLRVAGTNVWLFVDTSAAYRGRKARQNARRRGEQNFNPTVEDICTAAVRDWWAR